MLALRKNNQILRKFATLISDMRLSHYIAVGGASAAIDVGLVFILFQLLNISLAVATIVGFLAGLVVNFALNKLWSFKSKPVGLRKTQREVALYSMLVGFNLLFTYVAVSYLVSIGVSVAVAKIFTILATTLWNFVLYKKVIFK